MAAEQPKIEELFENARLRQTAAEQRAYLDGACGGNAALRQEVESLLKAHDQAANFLEVDTVTSPVPTLSEGPGTRIGRYKLLQLIGEGGFGSVFMAEQEAPVRRQVALKIIKLGMDTKQVIARFEAERQALAIMDHPHIAKVLDAGATEAGRPYFVMELVRGVPITNYCDTNNLPLPERLALFVQVCEAIQHAHTKGIIHRDLKPSNVMVTMADGRPAPKIIDFGVAKAIDQRLTEKTVFTELRQMIGTPQYMSPEQAEMAGIDIDTRSDVYSLGVLLYELLVGSTPFDPKELRSKGYGEMQRIIREVEPQRPSTRLSTGVDTLPSIAAHRRIEPAKLGKILKGELDWIVMRAMEKDRTRRYETANGLAMDVKRHLDHEPVIARPPSTIYRLGKFARKHRTAVTGAAAVGAALLLAVVGTGIGLVRARAALHRSKIAEADAVAQKDVANRLLHDVTIARAAAEGQSRRAQAANEFMRNMLSSARPGAAGGNADLKVSQILDDAAAHLDTLKDQPELELDGRLTLADTFASLDQYDKAFVNYDRALELSRTMTGPESQQTLQLTADAMLARSHLPSTGASAEPMAREGVAAARRVLGPRHPVTLDLLNSLGAILLNSHNDAAAEEIFRDLTSRVHEAGYVPPAKGSARFFNGLSVAVRRQGRVAEAEHLQRQAIDVARQEQRGDPWRTAMDLSNLALTLYTEGEYPDAVKAYRDALEYDRTALGSSHPQTLETMATLAGVLEQRSSFAQSLELREELLRQFTQKPGYSISEYSRQLLVVGELQLRMGRETEAAATFDHATASVHKLPQDYELVNEARRWWLQINLLQGLRIDRTWAGSAVHAQAAWTASFALAYHMWRGYEHELDLGEVDWSKLHFKIQPWKGSADSHRASAENDVAAEGGLTALWATPDPKPGAYLFSLAVPRRHAATLRAAQWMFVAPWKLTLFTSTLDQVQDQQKWKALMASSAAEERSAPILSSVRVGTLNQGFGPSRRLDGYALVATVTQSLPAGKYVLRFRSNNGFRIFHGRDLVTDAWKTTPTILAPITESPGGPLNQIRVEAEFVRLKPDALLPAMLSLTVEPVDGDARAMWSAEQSLLLPEELLDQFNADLARGVSNARTFQDRGATLARCGRFIEAVDDFGKSIELDPSVNFPWYWRGCTLAYLGNAEAYRANCSRMLERFAGSMDWPTLDRTVKSCLLLPSAEDPKRLAELTRRYLAEAKRTRNNVGYAELCQSMACYRLGDYTGSLESAQACKEEFQPIMQVNVPGVSPLMTAAESLIAMAQEHLHRHDQSVAALRRTRILIDQLPKAGRQDLGRFPEDWLICQTLFREAQGVVAVDNAVTAPPTQPAAH